MVVKFRLRGCFLRRPLQQEPIVIQAVMPCKKNLVFFFFSSTTFKNLFPFLSLIIICLSMKFLGVIMFGIYAVPWIWKTGEIFSYHFFEYTFSLMGFFWDYGGNIRLYSLVFHRLWGWCVHIFSVYFFSLWHKFFLIYIEVHKSFPLALLNLVSHFFHYGVAGSKHVRGSPLRGSVFMSCALAFVHLKRAHQTCSRWHLRSLLVQCQ